MQTQAQRQLYLNQRNIKRKQHIILETQDKCEERLKKRRALWKLHRNSQTQAQRQNCLDKLKFQRGQRTLIQRQNRLADKKIHRKISLAGMNQNDNTNNEFIAIKKLFKLSENKECLILRVLGDSKINHMRLQAEKVVNKIFHYRDSFINAFAKTFIFFKEKLRCSRLKVKLDSDLETILMH